MGCSLTEIKCYFVPLIKYMYEWPSSNSKFLELALSLSCMYSILLMCGEHITLMTPVKRDATFHLILLSFVEIWCIFKDFLMHVRIFGQSPMPSLSEMHMYIYYWTSGEPINDVCKKISLLFITFKIVGILPYCYDFIFCRKWSAEFEQFWQKYFKFMFLLLCLLTWKIKCGAAHWKETICGKVIQDTSC